MQRRIHADSRLEVYQLSALQDNYIYIVRELEQGRTAVIDPAQAEPVQAFLEERSWQLDVIWNTHHHGDHVGGNKALKQRYQCQVFASDYDVSRIPACDHGLKQGAEVSLGTLRFNVHETPGHTLGHIVYTQAESGLLFSGDTLFALGCGRLFEGTPELMWASLAMLARFPSDWKVLCTHEYTLSNARYAASLPWQHEGFPKYRAHLEALRAQGIPTVPSTLGEECAWNPFLQVIDPEWCRRQGLPHDPIRAFAILRAGKDQFS